MAAWCPNPSVHCPQQLLCCPKGLAAAHSCFNSLLGLQCYIGGTLCTLPAAVCMDLWAAHRCLQHLLWACRVELELQQGDAQLANKEAAVYGVEQQLAAREADIAKQDALIASLKKTVSCVLTL